VDSHALEIQRTRKRLLHPELMEREQMAGISGGQAVVSGTESSFPQNLSFRTIDTTSGRFGYIRIWNFEIEDVEGFVKEVARILGMLPQNGLVIDVRGNPGGTIPAGERILQFFTTRTIQPEPVFFRATDYTRLMAEWFPFLAQWKESLNLTVKTGSIFSQGFPLTTIEEANDIGQIYHGKVIVITDAICYSTCCFFAAGFQDHGIGPILGVDDTTGAGGANVWTQELLRRLWRLSSNSPLLPLPGGANMRVAVRRSTRVGAKAGLPLEGLGVASDCRHQLTLNDLVYENVDLLNKAGQIIASGS
jgi:C-terminal processing protease CtpA/Prc